MDHQLHIFNLGYTVKKANYFVDTHEEKHQLIC